MEERKYRIRTKVGDESPKVISVPLNQTYDTFEILSLKLGQINDYKRFNSDYGVIVGRILANGGLGVANAKISVFVPIDGNEDWNTRFTYGFSSSSDINADGIRYNTLPEYVDDDCHQNVGTFPLKNKLLDNNSLIEVFDKYWKYTTTTNESGDYMLFNIPVGVQLLHVDLDLSDCGLLSQRPRDLIGQGYDVKLFESPNKFKSSKNLNSLAQIYSQDKSVFVYPYWGDVSETDETLSITRCDINLQYKFEPTCVFMGSIVTDKASNAIGKNCTAKISAGNMADLTTGEGRIEMIRKTTDGKVEQFSIEGDRLIDSDGVWCYQIPMNLDYVMTDEFGNLVPTDNPERGIATRARVRFRISLDEQPDDVTATKRCRFLVPNNPRLNKDEYPDFFENKTPDYEFGTNTKEESYVDLFWNNVYTVKSYIPRLQKKKSTNNKRHTGIKQIKYYGDNNPMPYNSVDIKLPFAHRMVCWMTKLFIQLIAFVNFMLSTIFGVFASLCISFTRIKKLVRKILLVGHLLSLPFSAIAKLFCGITKGLKCMEIKSTFCDDESGIQKTYYPGCIGPMWNFTRSEEIKYQEKNFPPEERLEPDRRPYAFSGGDNSYLYTCIENALLQDNEASSFKFTNDWINGMLYAPLWYRKITPKRRYLFGLIKRKGKDQWCSDNGNNYGIRLFQPLALEMKGNRNTEKVMLPNGNTIAGYSRVNNEGKKCDGGDESECWRITHSFGVKSGLIVTKDTMLDETVYYYKPLTVEQNSNEVIFENDSVIYGENATNAAVELLFATDIVLLGSLNECDIHGIPQFFKSLPSTTYNMPSDLQFVDMDIKWEPADNGDGKYVFERNVITEESGCDWGNLNQNDQCGKMGKDDDGGLFYDISCTKVFMHPKTSVNLKRICEFGVTLDVAKFIDNLAKLNGDNNDDEYSGLLRPDGFISYDEISNFDERSMFATMNGNRLRTKVNADNGLLEYDFNYLYCDNFDGGLRDIMERKLRRCNATYKNNHLLERFSRDYYIFRMGETPYFYDKHHRFPRYENSFYFYFGLKHGKTAIEKFNSKYFADCSNNAKPETPINYTVKADSWCAEVNGEHDGYVKFDFNGISLPYSIIINSNENKSYGFEVNDISSERIYFCCESEPDYTINPKPSDLEGFEWVGSAIPRGEYTLTVTDGDGEISNMVFSVNGKLLTYNTSVTPFMIDNEQLKQINSSYDFISSLGVSGSTIEDETFEGNRLFNNKGLGGVIVIYGIFGDGEKMDFNDCKITLKPIEEDEYKVLGYTPVCIRKGVKVSNPNSVLVKTVKDINGEDITAILIGVPKGDINYELTVTEMCGDYDSNNSVTKRIMVEQPEPLRLYINGFDTELLSKFRTGWNVSGTPAKPQFRQEGNIIGWNNIGSVWPTYKLPDLLEKIIRNDLDINIDVEGDDDNEIVVYTINDNDSVIQITEDIVLQLINLLNKQNLIVNDITNEQSPYNFVNDYLFKYTENEFKKLSVYDKVNSIDELNRILHLRNGLPRLMREAFSVTCSDSPLMITSELTTQFYPVSYGMVHSPDVQNDDGDACVEGKKGISNSVFERTSMVETIIPTLSYHTSPNYGDGGTMHGECFARAKSLNSNNKIIKVPYLIAATNGIGSTKPDGLTTKTEDGVYVMNEKANESNKYFMFHTLDRIMVVNNVAWSRFEDIPYFNPEDTSKIGKTVNMEGLFAAKIYNGNGIDVGNSLTEFNSQTLGGKKLLIRRNSISEDDMPVERMIIGIEDDNVDEDFTKDAFENYYVDETITHINHQYASIRNNQTLDLNSSDSCYESGMDDNTIYGNLKIELNEDTVNDCRNTVGPNVSPIDSILSVNGNAIDRYYVFSLSDGITYPINHIANNKLSQTVYDEWNGKDHNIFSLKTTAQTFLDKRVKVGFVSHAENENGEDKIVNGYSDTGVFTSLQFAPIFIVGVTSNNCRVISPVYDFRDITCRVRLLNDGFSVYLDSVNNYYYLKNYKFSISLIGKTITKTKNDIDPATGLIIFDGLTKDEISDLNNYDTSGGSGTAPQPKMIVSIIDYTGLKHYPRIKFFR